MTRRTDSVDADQAPGETRRSGIELVTLLGTLLAAPTVAGLDAGLDESLAALAEYVGEGQTALVLRPGPTAASRAGDPLPPAPLGLSDARWHRLDDQGPVLDATALTGPSVLLPVRGTTANAVIGAIRIDGAEDPEELVARCVGGDLAEAARSVGLLFGSALARRAQVVAAEHDEHRARRILDQVGSVVVQVDGLGRISYVNRAWTELTGIPAEEMIGKGAMDRVHPDDRQVAAEHMAEGMRVQDQRVVRDVRFLDKADHPRWMEVQGAAVHDSAGQIIGFAGTLHDVTERRQETLNANAARDRAERARDRAERSNRAKSEFLSRMSHELRTPLNAILGFAQLLELAEMEGEDADNLNQIVRAGRHLLAVINDALDVTRIETGRLSLSVEDVHVELVVAETLDLMRPAAEAAGITLDKHTATGTGMVARADRQRLRQVLINLLSNAVKYNRPAGQVAVDYHPADDQGNRVDARSAEWLRITIADSGIGIPADRLDDVFLPFERLGAERTDVEGTGLGLSLTKSLLDAMGGRISLTSIEGLGTTFRLDLPAVVTAPSEVDTLLAETGAAPLPGVATTTVLYIEDNPANVTLVQRVLRRRENVHLVIATDGGAGLRLIQELRPALVLLDVHLPVMNGDEVLAALRSHPDPVLRQTPVTIVTADVSSGAERRLLAAGADAFVGKPIDVKSLLTEVDRYLT